VTLIRSWLRLEVRRRWRSLAVLALLVAVSTGVVLTSVAGARRGASALERLRNRTLPATAAVYANDPTFDWNRLRALPEVRALGTFVVTYAVALQGLPDTAVGFPPADDAVTRTIERPVVFAGRLYNPARADEAIVTPRFVSSYHKGVGDTVVLRLPTAQQLRSGEGTSLRQLAGPRVRLHIVGVARSPWLMPDSPNGASDPSGNGRLIPSPGVTARYRANLVGGGASAEYVNAIVRLRGGAADITRFRQDIARLTGRSDIEVVNLAEQQQRSQRAVTFEARCLLALAGAALVAAVFLVGQAVTRHTAASLVDLQPLQALGMTPREAVATAIAGVTVAGLVGTVLGAAGSIVASHWFPIGTASLLEPAPGVSVDWVVLGPGLACATLLVISGAALAGWTLRRAPRLVAARRRSAVARAAAGAGLPVPAVVGTRFALESGYGRTAVPARPALLGAIAGVLGIVAAFTVAHGVSDAANNPERFGQTHQLIGYAGLGGQDFGPVRKLFTRLAAQPDVRAVDDAKLGVAAGPRSDTAITLYSYEPVGRPLPVVITSGRMPASPNEVVLAPRTVSALHVRIGDAVRLTGDKGPTRLTLTGMGFVPEGPHNDYAEGGWVTGAGYNRLFTGFQYHVVLVALRAGIDPHAAGAALAKDVMTAIPRAAGFEFDYAYQPTQVTQIREVRVLPVVLGVFLGLLALGGVGHALATAVRRRSRDLAVLRALGMTRRAARCVVMVQATVLAVVGLGFGVPLGLAVGRSVWRVVADYTPLQYVSPMPMGTLLLLGPAALVAANVLAAWPAQRAARLRIADALRAE
jgi:hypothetical protein